MTFYAGNTRPDPSDGFANRGPERLALQSSRRETLSQTVSPSILQKVAAGDQAAVDECLRSYGAFVFGLCRRYLGVVSDIEDCVQEIFVDLWKHAGRFDPQLGSETTFVATIARRRLIDRCRKQRRRPGAQQLPDDLRSEETSQEDLAARGEEAERVLAAFELLSGDQRKVLELALSSGLTQTEIAEETGMPLGTVKSHARRGLNKVREILAREEAKGVQP